MCKREHVLVCCAALIAVGMWENANSQTCSVTPALLCQAQGQQYRTRTITIEDGGIGGVDIQRNFDVHCPSGNPTGAIPLVLMLHGGHGLPGGLEKDALPEQYSDNTQTTDLGKFFLVLPAAWDYDAGAPLDTQWNNRSDDLADDPPDRVDDVKFIDDLLDCLISEYDGTSPAWTIDTGKIYATGMSDGASMVNRLAVDITERFAAVASVSGRLSYVYDTSYQGGRLFAPNRYIPYMMVHGDREPGDPGACPPLTQNTWDGWYPPYDGCEGPNGEAHWCIGFGETSGMEVPRTVERWAEWNGCDPTPAATEPVDEDELLCEDSLGNDVSTLVSTETYSNCADEDVEVVHYVITNGGHHWPQGADTTDLCDGVGTNPPVDQPPQAWPDSNGCQSNDINGLEVALNFFADHLRTTDDDEDGVTDTADNCVLVANNNQRDTNSDGFGNICDPDLNNDCVVNFVDLGMMKSLFLPVMRTPI
jgi:poly(3-hydroxybutyrate) depolymerase